MEAKVGVGGQGSGEGVWRRWATRRSPVLGINAGEGGKEEWRKRDGGKRQRGREREGREKRTKERG